MSTPKSRASRARDVALFRYTLIRPLADPALSPAERGAMARELAGRVHRGPAGEPVAVSRASVDRWLRAWRDGGFDALLPAERQVRPRTEAAVLELAEFRNVFGYHCSSEFGYHPDDRLVVGSGTTRADVGAVAYRAKRGSAI